MDVLKFKIIACKVNIWIKFHEKKDFYIGARMGAECVANVIGFENMIKLHFENNLDEIQKQFNGRVSIKLQELMTDCLLYDNNRKKSRLDKIKGKIMQISQEISK